MLATATAATAGSRSGGRALVAAAVKSAAGTAAGRPAAVVHVGTGSSNHCMHYFLYSTSAPTSYSLDRPTGSSFSFGGTNSPSSGGGDGTGAFEIAGWPIRRSNTLLNIVPQGQRFVVERFGRLSAIHDSGYFFAVPFVDRIGEWS